MGRKITVSILDDLDGTPIDPEGHIPVTFALHGTTYTLDLSPTNGDAFYAALSPYVDAATKIGTRAGNFAAPATTPSAEIRKWANANGYTVSPRGRIPYAVIEAYTDHHKER